MILSYKQQLDLVDKGLAKASVNGKFTTFKYAKKVMYDYLWEQHPELKYCRGQTYDNTNGNIVTVPPAKTFNYLENNTWSDLPLDTPVTLYKKYNGFMAALSIYQGEIVVSTTGTTNSDYARLAKEEIFKKYPEPLLKGWVTKHGNSNATWLFEICHESDPHIVDEELGVHYLGCTSHEDGNFTPIGAALFSSIRNALKLAKTQVCEGWMMYLPDGTVCKLKTDYYVGKKKLMRMKKSAIDRMYNATINNFDNFKLPDVWLEVLPWIVNSFSQEQWSDLSEVYRRQELELWWNIHRE